MGSISKGKIRNIKTSEENKNNSAYNNIFNNQQNSKLDIETKYNYNNIFKKLYNPSREEINNNINYSKKINNNENKSKNENNEDSIDEANYIIFKNNKSYDFGCNVLYTKKQYNDINNNNDIESISLTLIENDNLNNIRETNSSKEKESDNSDYLDISQSFLFFQNKTKIFNKKNIYGNETFLRNSYYYNLIIRNIWHPFTKDKKYNTLFFFDWDDTLLCTSYIIPILNSQKKSKENINFIKKNLTNLDENVSKLLKYTMYKGSVFVITNSSPGWVEYSSVCFMPLTAKLLTNIKIISCRGLYSKNYPGDPKQWKIKAFKYCIESNKINTKLISNIICFGDSIIDLEAIETLRDIFNNAYIKTIKFKENPHPIQLEKQIFLVYNQIDFIVNKAKNLTLKVYKKKVD